MTTWTDADLARYGDAEEVRIAGMRRDGSLRTPSDRVGGARRRRALHPLGERAGRCVVPRRPGPPPWAVDRRPRRGADVDFVDGSDPADDDLIDAAYQRKYGRYPGPVKSITSPTARSTTLKLVPHQPD